MGSEPCKGISKHTGSTTAQRRGGGEGQERNKLAKQKKVMPMMTSPLRPTLLFAETAQRHTGEAGESKGTPRLWVLCATAPQLADYRKRHRQRERSTHICMYAHTHAMRA